MSLHVIEGTWEEIKRHEAELIDHRLRVTFERESPAQLKPVAPAKTTPKVKELRARGMLAGLLSSEDYFREKREETIREDRELQ